MLDKNPDQSLPSIIFEAKKYLKKNVMTSILCNEPFTKAIFLAEFIKQTTIPIIYLDFDLLYSGYIVSNIFEKRNNVTIFSPSKNDLEDILKKVLTKLSLERSIVIIDSLNGLYNLFDDKDIGRLVNAYIMLLGFVAKESDSNVLFVSMARKKEDEGWVLSPSGRHVVDAKLITKVFLKRNDSRIKMVVLDND